MKIPLSVVLLVLCLSFAPNGAQSASRLSIQMTNGLCQISLTGATGAVCQIQYVNDLTGTNWSCLSSLAVTNSPCAIFDTNSAPGRFYRALVAPASLALAPAGTFAMGDTFGDLAPDELPVHTVSVSAFYIERTEVTKALWDIVRSWATNNGYNFSANAGFSKAITYPATMVNWYDAVKWCNARSEMEGLTPCYFTNNSQTGVYRAGQITISNSFVNWTANGYRLPTEAEWEKAARGGAAGHRFPWTDTNVITHSRANYYSTNTWAYDVSPTRGYNPLFTNGPAPYLSPCGYFATNGFGLYDMSGNVWEWCWDYYDANWYTNAAAVLADTTGPAPGSNVTQRVLRGGSWDSPAPDARCANRDSKSPSTSVNETGFRCVRRP